MPELAEIRIVANQLNKEFAGQVLSKINILSGPYLNGDSKYKSFRISLKKFVKSTISKIETKGKTMYIELTPLSKDNVVVNEYLVIGFGLTGGFQFTKDEHSRIEFVITDLNGNARSIYYNDIRNFGTFAFMIRQDLNIKLNAMGPDIFELTEEELVEQLGLTSIQKHEIAKALLNQKIIAGIGNYLRAEILYEAGINPLAKVSTLKNTDIKHLHAAILKVVGEVMDKCGSPNYADIYGNVGSYKFRVYQQSKAPNGKPVVRTELAGRSIYHV